jgi:ribA/ribD-fused uncharacterized protein
MNEIKGFSGEYRWLSNFYQLEYPINFLGQEFNTTENLYQAMKCNDYEDFVTIANSSPALAKKLGRQVKLVKNWDLIRLQTMEFVQLLKYEQPTLRNLLIETGDAYIEETNHWNDIFFGVCNGIGENHLGKIIMKIRKHIKDSS